jgi:diaminohydroxyphosphoribosylaminopyrimidine deaminase/5-amino-6-(5-phosphoribosylamino)uracil reductase
MDDEGAMLRAVELAEGVRGTTSPNPWVGAVLCDGSDLFEGATSPPGGPHAERAVLDLAGPRARGATMYVTLEPCAHEGRTGPCADAIIEAGVARVVIGTEDPDERVSGRGIARLRMAGVEVRTGVAQEAVAAQLAPYLKQRRTGRPWVTLKLAATMDGRIAAPDGSSRWISSPESRADAHRLRAAADAVLVGAGTLRVDDPRLTARPPEGEPSRQPARVVLGRAAPGAAAQPLIELAGPPGSVLDQLGARGVLQLLVEGGAGVAHELHSARLVDTYVLYLAPVLLGGDDGVPMFRGQGSASLKDAWRGTIVSVRRLGPDLRVELQAAPADDGEGARCSPA